MADHLDRWRRQSPYSDPGGYADLLLAVPDDVESLCAASRNTIAHYRAELPDLAAERRGEIDSRWLERILALDQARHPAPLTAPRQPGSRVAGCCRDHSLFLTGALRARGVPARNVVGFAGYFAPGFHHDHVVVEYWDSERWVRTDPELTRDGFDFDVRDMPRGPGAPFETAAEVWLGHRSGVLDAAGYGVEPSLPELCGPEFVGEYVVFQLAHRYGDELLLWDMWAGPLEPAVLDGLAGLLVRADAGDAAAEAELAGRYASEAGLRPGPTITRTSPYGYPPVRERLVRPGRAEPAG
ncbi:transglutaminase domain-containing protein [Propionicimonas sp.]|uniref:transglutaminase domain-containing protein n=1 Tax=Propionicimonas sp. TaxID=1955623 RepID=UPI0039E5C930